MVVSYIVVSVTVYSVVGCVRYSAVVDSCMILYVSVLRMYDDIINVSDINIISSLYPVIWFRRLMFDASEYGVLCGCEFCAVLLLSARRLLLYLFIYI